MLQMENLDRVTIAIEDLSALRQAAFMWLGGVAKATDMKPAYTNAIRQALENTGPAEERKHGVYAFVCLCGAPLDVPDNQKEVTCAKCNRVALIGWDAKLRLAQEGQ